MVRLGQAYFAIKFIPIFFLLGGRDQEEWIRFFLIMGNWKGKLLQQQAWWSCVLSILAKILKLQLFHWEGKVVVEVQKGAHRLWVWVWVRVWDAGAGSGICVVWVMEVQNLEWINGISSRCMLGCMPRYLACAYKGSWEHASRSWGHVILAYTVRNCSICNKTLFGNCSWQFPACYDF